MKALSTLYCPRCGSIEGEDVELFTATGPHDDRVWVYQTTCRKCRFVRLRARHRPPKISRLDT